MAQVIGVQGLGLPYPGALYPTTVGLPPVPSIAGTNALSLAPGDAILIPSGSFYVTLGQYTTFQVLELDEMRSIVLALVVFVEKVIEL